MLLVVLLCFCPETSSGGDGNTLAALHLQSVRNNLYFTLKKNDLNAASTRCSFF